MTATEINGCNTYAYCINNPICFVDPEGCSVLAALGTVLLVLLGMATVVIVEETFHPIEKFFDALSDGISILTDFVSDSLDNFPSSKKRKSNKKGKNKDPRKNPDQRVAPRIKFSSRKKAKEAAEKVSKRFGQRGVRYHKNKFGKHFHPNVPKDNPFYHWHYYFCNLIISLLDDENSCEE